MAQGRASSHDAIAFPERGPQHTPTGPTEGQPTVLPLSPRRILKKTPSLAPSPRRRLELAFAILMPFVALALQSRIWGSFQPLPFVLFYPALVLSSWVGGRVGGGIAMLLSIGFADWFFMAPLHSLAISAPGDVVRVLCFVVLGLIVIHVHHRSRLRTEQYRSNISERKHAEAQLKASEQRMRKMLDNIPTATACSTLGGNAGLTFLNRQFVRLFGYTLDEIPDVGAHPSCPDAPHAGGPKAPWEITLCMAAADRVSIEPIETRVRCRDGTILDVLVSADQLEDMLLVSFIDITARKQAEQRLRHMAQHDPLTDLPNRVLFDEHVSAALAVAHREHTRFGLMFIDLDKFKEVNDTLGHRIGDLLLREVSQRLRQAVRVSDIPARIGGDEFVVLLHNLHHADHALPVGEKIRARLSTPFTIESHTFTISASIGIAVYPDHGTDAIELARSADAAMYRAKEGGRDRVELLASAPAALQAG